MVRCFAIGLSVLGACAVSQAQVHFQEVQRLATAIVTPAQPAQGDPVADVAESQSRLGQGDFFACVQKEVLQANEFPPRDPQTGDDTLLARGAATQASLVNASFVKFDGQVSSVSKGQAADDTFVGPTAAAQSTLSGVFLVRKQVRARLAMAYVGGSVSIVRFSGSNAANPVVLGIEDGFLLDSKGQITTTQASAVTSVVLTPGLYAVNARTTGPRLAFDLDFLNMNVRNGRPVPSLKSYGPGRINDDGTVRCSRESDDDDDDRDDDEGDDDDRNGSGSGNGEGNGQGNGSGSGGQSGGQGGGQGEGGRDDDRPRFTTTVRSRPTRR